MRMSITMSRRILLVIVTVAALLAVAPWTRIHSFPRRLLSQARRAPAQSRCVSSEECWPAAEELRQLGGSLQGDLVLPGDKLWKAATKLKNKLLDISPGAVVMAMSAEDVQAAVRFAKNRSLDVSVKSTGSCYSGNCMKQGSLHIDLSHMNAAVVNKDLMQLEAQPGTNFAALYELCDAQDVLVVGGMCPGVGPVGYSLGGGHGPLVRSFGLGADNIVSVELVTADGELIHVSADANSDLFWALRGGGGGAFGIVVGIALRLHPAPPQMVSLSCAWPLSKGGKRVGESILSEWHSSIMPALPDQWQFYSVAMKSPLGPKVPGWNYLSMNGLFIVEGLYNGPWSQDMLDSVDRLLRLGKEEQLKCEFVNFTSLKSWHDQAWFASEGPVDFRVQLASSFAQPNLDHAAHATLMVDTVTALPMDAVNMLFGVQLGGKVSKPDSETSVSAAFRSAVFFQENDADWNFARADAHQIAWAREVGDAMAALDGFSGSYVNEPDPSKARGVYEDLFWGNETFAALQVVKRKWDPEAFFDCAQCVHN